jgi:hypothetical protein
MRTQTVRTALGKNKFRQIPTDSPQSQANAAFDAGFYLEAIALWEVLITDRLEQYLNTLQGSGLSFSSLGKLLSKLNETLFGKDRTEKEDELYELIESLHDWFGSCHTNLHGLAKIPEHDKDKWNDTAKPLRKLAKQGRKHFKHINRLTQDIRFGG